MGTLLKHKFIGLTVCIYNSILFIIPFFLLLFCRVLFLQNCMQTKNICEIKFFKIIKTNKSKKKNDKNAINFTFLLFCGDVFF